MTYALFLLWFLVIPILALAFARRAKLRQGWWWKAVGFTIAAALVYTTPWDNYLVATGVWYYDRARVWGILLGYVPLEEYLFFVLQTVLGALVVHALWKSDG